jgi:hypothetical protein
LRPRAHHRQKGGCDFGILHRVLQLFAHLFFALRAAEQDHIQMLDALLAGADGLSHAYGKRRVAGERQSLFLRFVRDGQVSFAREQRIDLDEIHAALFERDDRLPSLPLIGHRHRIRPYRFRPVHNRPCRDDAGADHTAFLDPSAPQAQRFPGAAHVANSGDAVGDEQRQKILAGDVRVHIPQTRNQEFARSLDHLSVLRNLDLGGFAYRRDAVASDDDGHIGFGFSACGVNHRDSVDDQRFGLRLDLRLLPKAQRRE